MSTFYEYCVGSGSGSTTCVIAIDKDIVRIHIRNRWMGSDPIIFDIVGKYSHIDGPYGIIETYEFINMETKERIKATDHFDIFLFETPIKTESHSNFRVFPSEGWQPYSTDQFQLYLARNKNIYSDNVLTDKCQKVVNIISGLKYEAISSDKYKDRIEHFNK